MASSAASSVTQESGAQLYSRLTSRPLLDDLGVPFLSERHHTATTAAAATTAVGNESRGGRGRVVEICGEEGTAKTELMLHCLAQCILPQRWKGRDLHGRQRSAVWVDTDFAFILLRLVTVLEKRLEQAAFAATSSFPTGTAAGVGHVTRGSPQASVGDVTGRTGCSSPPAKRAAPSCGAVTGAVQPSSGTRAAAVCARGSLDGSAGPVPTAEKYGGMGDGAQPNPRHALPPNSGMRHCPDTSHANSACEAVPSNISNDHGSSSSYAINGCSGSGPQQSRASHARSSTNRDAFRACSPGSDQGGAAKHGAGSLGGGDFGIAGQHTSSPAPAVGAGRSEHTAGSAVHQPPSIKERETFVSACLARLYVLRCESSRQLAGSLEHGVSELLSEASDDIGLLVIDSVAAFYWQDGSSYGVDSAQAALATVVRSVADRHNLLVLASKPLLLLYGSKYGGSGGRDNWIAHKKSAGQSSEVVEFMSKAWRRVVDERFVFEKLETSVRRTMHAPLQHRDGGDAVRERSVGASRHATAAGGDGEDEPVSMFCARRVEGSRANGPSYHFCVTNSGVQFR